MGRCAKVLLHAIYTLHAVCYLQPLETLMFIDCEGKKRRILRVALVALPFGAILYSFPGLFFF